MTKTDVITMSLSNAKDWKQKGQPLWVVRSLSTVIANRFSIALANGGCREDTLRILAEDGFENELSWYCEELLAVKQGIECKKIPGAAIGGNYLPIVMHHLARLLGSKDNEVTLLEVATSADSMNTSTKLWQEYANGLKAIASGKPFKPKKLAKVKDQEQYWLPYIELMASICEGSGIDEAVQIIDDAFSKRNQDETITEDQYELEGSGQHPIRWDYRKECIHSYR